MNHQLSLWNEVWRDDGWWWWCDEVCVGVKFCEGKGWMFPARINFRWDGDIHGNHWFGWEWIFVRGRGVSLYEMRFVWGLVWCRDVLCFLYNWNSVRWMGISLYEMKLEWIVVWCRDVLCFLYNSNFMWWMTNYLYEMKLDECDAVISSTHSYHPIIQILWDQPSTISIWYHFQQWCLHHLSTPILSDFALIQIPWGSYTYVPM